MTTIYRFIVVDKNGKPLIKKLSKERKQCEIIWKPVYEEYRRLGYRLKKVEEIKLL